MTARDVDAAEVCGALAGVLRGWDGSDDGYEAVRRCYAVALDAAGLTPHMVDSERQRFIDALADCVARATEYGDQDGGFVAMYLLPTGPIHRAIPLLQQAGVTVRPGFDGRKQTEPT